MSTRHAPSTDKLKGIIGRTYIDRPATKDELAAYFGVHRRTVDFWIADGLIPRIKINNTIRFNIAEIERAFTIKGRVK